MNQSVPPPMQSSATKRMRTMRIVILILLVCFFVFGLFPIVVATIMGISMFAWVKQAAELNYTSYADKFQVTVLAMKSGPNYFSERVRIRSERDMRASIWVTDLKEAGIFETNSPNGEILYREGHPHKIGSSVPIHADGKFSTCDILFTVSTTSSNTVWHDEVAGGTLDTTLPTPLTVSGVQTNWPDLYERDLAIPLANLGDCKILLSVK
jgi:hypothetical protein